MERVIKFRAWDGAKMYLPEYSEKEDFHLLADGTIVETHEHGVERHEFTSRRGENWIVMQFTGLLDKNGKEIYEGDIICGYFSNGDRCLHQIKWNENEAKFDTVFIDRLTVLPNDFSGLSQDWINNHSKTVIGNIYENPELLNEHKASL